jgi:hypothetical protein
MEWRRFAAAIGIASPGVNSTLTSKERPHENNVGSCPRRCGDGFLCGVRERRNCKQRRAVAEASIGSVFSDARRLLAPRLASSSPLLVAVWPSSLPLVVSFHTAPSGAVFISGFFFEVFQFAAPPRS